jgi:ribosome silencing factor RsfS/YbeB/iojap
VKAEELVGEIERYAADKKAGEIVELDLRGVLGYTDYFVLCTGNTERQTKAIHDGILEGCKHEHEIQPRRVEGLSQRDWILMWWSTSSRPKHARFTGWSSSGARRRRGWRARAVALELPVPRRWRARMPLLFPARATKRRG